MAATKRLLKELKDLETSPIEGVTASPNKASDLFKWTAKIQGPVGSPYEGGTFELTMEFPDRYPFEAPKCAFKTKIFHCNISASGGICLDILKDKWTPALKIGQVLLSLSSLFTDPNPDSPLHWEAGQMYKNNRKEHDKTAREWTRQHATPK